MASDVDLCNRALTLLGASARITTIGENSANGQLCQLLYDPTRLSVLAAHPWNFAKRRAVLTRLSATPPFKWSYYYEMPVGYVRVIGVYADGDCYVQMTEYAEEAYEESGTQTKRVIATSAEAVYLEYVADTQASRDVNQMPVLFRDALVTKLAADMAVEKTEHLNKADLLNAKFERIIAQARSQDTMNDPPEMIPWGPAIDAR